MNSAPANMMNKGWSKLTSMFQQSDKDIFALEDPQYGELCDDADDVTKKLGITIKGKDGRTEKVKVEVNEDTEKIIEIRVPANVKAGEPIAVLGPNGSLIRTHVPNGLSTGDAMFVPVPKQQTQKGFFSWGSQKKLEVEALRTCP